MKPLRVYRRLVRALLWFSIPSTALGIALTIFGDGFWRGFGVQAAAWGLIDTCLAVYSLVSGRRRLQSVGTATTLTRLARTLRLNGFLDIGYIAVGILVAAVFGPRGLGILGHGIGIAVQGAFLLVFDFYFAGIVSQAASIPSSEESHGGKNDRGENNDSTET